MIIILRHLSSLKELKYRAIVRRAMWLALGIVFLFIALVMAAYSVNCLGGGPVEGFTGKGWGTPPTPTKRPTVGPPPRGLLEGEETEQGRSYTTIADLPRAPNGYVAGDAPVLYENPTSAKVSAARIYALLEDMKAFNGFELPYLVERGDPSVQISISTFRGQLQSLADEAAVLNVNLGAQSTITEKDFEAIQANVRYLQKRYRTLENVGLVPGGTGKEFKSEQKEGFTVDGSGDRATLNDLKDVLVKLDEEIARLSKSGTTDPVLGARMGLFRQVRDRIQAIVRDVVSGTMSALDIPILKADVARFLPALGSSSSSTGVDDSEQTGETLVQAIRKWFLSGSWLTSRDASGALVDGSGSLLSLVGRAEAERIAEKILKGMSIDFHYKFTGENEVTIAQANAVAAAALSAESYKKGGSAGTETEEDCVDGFTTSAPYSCTAKNARGAFESTIIELEKGFVGGRPVGKSAGEPARLDWRERAKGICENIRKAGLKPQDYGCFTGSTEQVGPNYSWRGHAKMVCTRLEANGVAGTAQTMGCPPVNWKGWRT